MKTTGKLVSLLVELEINLIEGHSFYVLLLIDEGNPNEEINISSFQFVFGAVHKSGSSMHKIIRCYS